MEKRWEQERDAEIARSILAEDAQSRRSRNREEWEDDDDEYAWFFK